MIDTEGFVVRSKEIKEAIARGVGREDRRIGGGDKIADCLEMVGTRVDEDCIYIDAPVPKHDVVDFWEEVIPPRRIISGNTPKVVRIDSDPFDDIKMGMREILVKELFGDPDTYLLDSIKGGKVSILELSALKALMLTVKDSAGKLEEAIEAYVPASLEPVSFAMDFGE